MTWEYEVLVVVGFICVDAAVRSGRVRKYVTFKSFRRVALSWSMYSQAEERIGTACLAQNNQITSQFNSAMNTTVNSQISYAMKARRTVQNAKLSLDAAKSSARNAKPETIGESRG